MGWYGIGSTYGRSLTPAEKKAIMDDNFNYGDTKVLKSTMRGAKYYAVLKTPKGNYALICHTSTSGGEFGYKPIDEFMGPLDYDFPVSWIKLLSPTDNEFANKWRMKVLAKSKKASKPSVPFVTEKTKPVMVKGTKYNKTTQMKFM